MTTEPVEQTETEGAPPKRAILSGLLEFGFWVISPFVLMLVALILALIFGAPHGRVIGVFAALAAAAGGYFIYRPNARLRVRKARGAGLLYAGIVAGIGAIGASMPAPPPSTAQTDTPPAAVSSADPGLSEEERRAVREAAAARAEEELRNVAEQRRVEYVARLEREMSQNSAQTFLRNTETTEEIILGVAMFSALASVYQDGASLSLSPEQEQVRQRFKARLIQWQVSALPELRNRFGPAMARRVWRENMEVRTVGTGYRTIDLSWGGFASNANIEDFHTVARENFQALRFRRAQYRWYAGADRYTYYTLEGPRDDQLMVARGGRWVVVED